VFRLCRKHPNASKETAWQYLFPSTRIGKDPRSGIKRRHHLHHSVLQKHTHSAIREARINKFASCYTFRHTFATELLTNGYDIHTIQKLMGHSDISTTEIYLHVIKQAGFDVKSPADNLTAIT
jgi:site-specific recombinase XerD